MSFLGIPHPLGAAPARQPSARADLPARCIWLTGLPAAGKTTLASALEQRLRELGRMTCVLDGDSLRKGLCRDLGFSEADRVENIRRVAEVARLMVDAGLTVMVALVSPFRAQRRLASQLLSDGEFIEVFVDTPLEECERRDPKGMYARARKGELKDFTGIGSRYERPENPDVRIDTRVMSVQESVERVLRLLA
ncbi:MAG TPA: adenylyl-sulfate kinase [Burkholderiales bacterium]|jgi:bifunctional enzyme CysN/CysC|nr:adenylyl-sulfate kinase [Burkholderiales bacterium]